MRQKILIVKLAALGDVACAARALADSFGKIPEKTEFHWLIDPAYAPLASSLLSNIGFAGARFHSVDSTALFQGGTGKKLLVTATLLRECARLKPSAIVLLHRDSRYRLVLRTVFRGPIYAINAQAAQAETLSYQDAFARLKKDLFPKHQASAAANLGIPIVESDHLGILVGGGANTKGTFLEKRWPHLESFIQAVLDQTAYRISLFGGPNDALAAENVCARFAAAVDSNRITSLAGKTPLQELPLLLRKLRCFVAIDSGLAHIAAAVMTSPEQRIISLFGPTDPVLWAPVVRGQGRQAVLYKKIACSPCYKNDGNFKPCIYRGDSFQLCMKDIPVTDVLSALACI